MSKRSDLVVACLLGNRWRATSAPAAGTTCVATAPTPTSATQRVHLETLWYSVKNLAGAGVTYTVQVQVRGAANTVLASVDHLVGISQTANVAITNFAFANPKLGTGLNVFMNTVLTSVTQSLNISGWIEDTNG